MKIRHEYIPTSEMVADMITKPLGRVHFEKLRKLCGLSIKRDKDLQGRGSVEMMSKDI